MAKPDHTWVGSSCHVHGSLWRGEEAAFAGESDVFQQFLAGWIACSRELALFLAPTINSYKRYAAESWAPTTLAWGHDNRTCGFRIVGHGAGLRVETRIPGRRRQSVSRVRRAAGGRPVGDRAGPRAAGGLRGQRLRVGRRALPVHDEGGDRGARRRDDGSRGARRPGRRPLPQLRPARTGACSTGRSRATSASASSSAANHRCQTPVLTRTGSSCEVTTSTYLRTASSGTSEKYERSSAADRNGGHGSSPAVAR